MFLHQAIERNAKSFPNKTATVFGDRRKTWSELQNRIAKLAGALQAHGIKPGDRVAMLALNSDRYVEYFYAVPWLGAAVVPVNIRWSLKENQYSLEDAGATVLLVDDTFAEMGQALKECCPEVQTLIYTGEKAAPEGMLDYEIFLAAGEAIQPAAKSKDQMAGIFYTGGTTGFPKGVMLSHNGICTSALAAMADFGINRPGRRTLHVAPMFHCACATMMWASTLCGNEQVIIPAFSIAGTLGAIESYKITDTLLVPTMITMMLGDDSLEKADISSLDHIIYGASPMPEGTLLEAMQRMPQVGFRQAYGQTELSPLCSTLSPDFHVVEGEYAGKLRSAGRPGLGVDVEIRDEAGKALPAGKVGEVAVSGPNVMMGYWNNEAQTANTLVDGWVMTGDAGYMDEDGFIFLVDRVKDMIVSGGENIFSAEVESAISNHPAVLESVVIGIPSDDWGESVHAIVRLRDGSEATAEEIIATCREHIAGYKLPRSVEFRADAFPITGAGKIQKNVLREPFWKDKEKRIN